MLKVEKELSAEAEPKGPESIILVFSNTSFQNPEDSPISKRIQNIFNQKYFQKSISNIKTRPRHNIFRIMIV